MPAVQMKTREQYIKAIEVLTRVGGTYQGVGQDERYLLVNEAQYQALVEAGVAPPPDADKEPTHGKKPRKEAKS
jgi:hypothetical protein